MHFVNKLYFYVVVFIGCNVLPAMEIDAERNDAFNRSVQERSAEDTDTELEVSVVDELLDLSDEALITDTRWHVKEEFNKAHILFSINYFMEKYPQLRLDCASRRSEESRSLRRIDFKNLPEKDLIWHFWSVLERIRTHERSQHRAASPEYRANRLAAVKLLLAHGVFPKKLSLGNGESLHVREEQQRFVANLIQSLHDEIERQNRRGRTDNNRFTIWAQRYLALLRIYEAHTISRIDVTRYRNTERALQELESLRRVSKAKTINLLLAEIIIDLQRYNRGISAVYEGREANYSTSEIASLIRAALRKQSNNLSARAVPQPESDISKLEKIVSPLNIIQARKQVANSYQEAPQPSRLGDLEEEETRTVSTQNAPQMPVDAQPLVLNRMFSVDLVWHRIFPANNELVNAAEDFDGIEFFTYAHPSLREDLKFKPSNVSGRNFDCFFNAMGLERDGQIERLKGMLDDDNIRFMIGNEIANYAYVEGDVSRRGESSLDDRILAPIDYAQFQKDMEDAALSPRAQEEALTRLFARASQKNVCKEFLDIHVKSKLTHELNWKMNAQQFTDVESVGLGESPTVGRTLVLIDAIAYANRMGLKIYQDKNRGPAHSLELIHEFVPRDFTKIAHLYYKGGHYQMLTPLPTDEALLLVEGEGEGGSEECREYDSHSDDVERSLENSSEEEEEEHQPEASSEGDAQDSDGYHVTLIKGFKRKEYWESQRKNIEAIVADIRRDSFVRVNGQDFKLTEDGPNGPWRLVARIYQAKICEFLKVIGPEGWGLRDVAYRKLSEENIKTICELGRKLVSQKLSNTEVVSRIAEQTNFKKVWIRYYLKQAKIGSTLPKPPRKKPIPKNPRGASAIVARRAASEREAQNGITIEKFVELGAKNRLEKNHYWKGQKANLENIGRALKTEGKVVVNGECFTFVAKQKTDTKIRRAIAEIYGQTFKMMESLLDKMGILNEKRKATNWTEEDSKRLRALLVPGECESKNDVARRMGRTVFVCEKRASDLGLTWPTYRKNACKKRKREDSLVKAKPSSADNNERIKRARLGVSWRALD